MVKTIHLVRHGHHALLGHKLCGRMPGVGLDDQGCRQMARCTDFLLPPPSAIQSSPQQRTRQSANILAARFGLAVEIVPAMDEIDLGDWTGRSFEELEGDVAWTRWNHARGSSRPPNGETMQALQARVVRHLEQLRHDDSDGALVIVSHAEPIRAALLHYSQLRLDDYVAIEVEPASITTLSVDRAGIHISTFNQRVPA
ncbi:MAG: histidine phosphatase family protein [Bradyrhizobium sp.]|uniref:histidine phosphatase family protein n=1 Tax=Bradyrhizobium sp. TaxID=376 RepID=UPI001D956D23|nr:histidine phosphatase family protein [Bradyrhizobium sp.]MBV9561435.1 histidine phosphatase family protein [Bradyrhizobium sp.]